MKKSLIILTVLVIMVTVLSFSAFGARVLRYSHMNAPKSVAGLQATYFAELVKEKTNGEIEIQVYPSSQLGNLQEMAEGVSMGTVAFHHNTAAAIGSLYKDFAALDTPFIYRDVDHLLKVTAPSSPVIKELNDALIKKRDVRVLYSFYFGTRHLTLDRAVYEPADLNGLKVRAIPFKIYMAAVEGLGAVATPVDWSEVPTALATGTVNGQENPLDVIYSNKLNEIQSHLMLTGHIKASELVVVNESIWQSLSVENQQKIREAAEEASQYATNLVLEKEEKQLAALKEAGMTVISEEDGLDLKAFKENTLEIIDERFDEEYGYIYDMIRSM